jgi:uncharacterized membrane protein YqjE
MPEPTTEDRRTAAQAGFFGHATGFLGGLADYVRLRLELAGIEAREAAAHYAIIAGLLAGALVVTVFGYLFLCIAVIFALAALIDDPHGWIWITLGAALVHFGAAVAVALIVRAKFAAPMFAATLQEFKKDEQWLTSTTAKKF